MHPIRAAAVCETLLRPKYEAALAWFIGQWVAIIKLKVLSTLEAFAHGIKISNHSKKLDLRARVWKSLPKVPESML